MSRREQFLMAWQRVSDPKYLVVAIHLPSGVPEIITNAYNLGEKFDYILRMYDENLAMNGNSNIYIEDWMIV